MQAWRGLDLALIGRQKGQIQDGKVLLMDPLLLLIMDKQFTLVEISE